MSNIFKRLRLIGRREETQKREENSLNLNAEANQQNSCEPNAKEHLEQNQRNASRDFCHQRPRYRRSARKRLHFSSEHEEEPAISCRKISREEIPHASHPDAKEVNAESYNGIPLTDDSVTKSNVHSADDVNSKPFTKGANDSMNESFEALMPDLLSSNPDLSTRKITPKSNEATPDPPVLHRMDTDPRTDRRPQSLSKEDVNLLAKSPVARVNARKEECQLLKLLFSDDDTSQNNPLPLLSISKVKSSPAYSLGRQISIAAVKTKDAGKGSVKKNVSQIEENNLNTPLVESNRQNSAIPLLLSRSSRRKMQALDDKIKECSDESVAVVELESRRVGEDLHENPVRNNRAKQDSGQDRESDKENDETAGRDGVILAKVDEMPCKESTKSKKTKEEPNSWNSETIALAELETEYNEEDSAQNDDVFDADVQEIQQEKENDRRELKYQEPKEPTESTEVVEEMQLESKEPTELTQVEDESDQGIDQSQKTNTPHVQGGAASGLQHCEENSSRQSSKDPSRQDIAEPADSPRVDNSSERVDCPKKNGLKEGNAEGMRCKKDTDGQNDAKELNSQQGLKLTESTETENERESGRESQDRRIEIGEEVHGMHCSEGDVAEDTNFLSVQENSRATELPEIETVLEETRKESQETIVRIITEEGDADLNLFKEGNDCKDSNSRKITRLPKPTEVDNYWNRGVTFESRAYVPAGHLDAQISGDLSPTITPRETYEMFAAPNSHGKFNGRWPMAEGTMSHLARPRGRGRGRSRKIKTEWCQRVNPFNSGNIDTYSMPWNNIDWHGMMSASRSHYSQEDGMFAVTGAMSQGPSQDFNNVGGYYSCVMSSREQMPLGSSDDLDVARAASSDSGIDSQGASELESEPSGIKTKKENEHVQGNAAHYRGHEQVDQRYGNNTCFQPSLDGFYMIDSAGRYVPVNHPYGTMIPPQGFQGGSYGPYGYSGPIERQYYPKQRDRSCTNAREGTEELSMSGTKQQDSDYQFKEDSSPSILNAGAGGDDKSTDETSQQTSQDTQDILDALKILLRDAFDPTVSDPGELLALYGAELLKDEELKLEFIYFCEQLLNYEIMMSQSGGFIPGACGDFTYPYPNHFTNPPMWPPPGMQSSSSWYRNDVSYYYDGESCIPVGVCQDPQGNLRMVLPDGHPDQYGPKDYMLIYGGPDGNAVRVSHP